MAKKQATMQQPGSARLSTRVHLTLGLRIRNEPAALARVLLVFSRRRLRIEALRFVDAKPGDAPGELEVELACDPETARLLPDQLRRIIEVLAVTGETRAAVSAPGDDPGVAVPATREVRSCRN